MSDGPYGRHGFNANAGGYGGGASYGNAAGGGYAAPSYGQSYGAGASYSAPAPQDGAYGSQYGAYGGNGAYQVRRTVIVGCLLFWQYLESFIIVPRCHADPTNDSRYSVVF